MKFEESNPMVFRKKTEGGIDKTKEAKKETITSAPISEARKKAEELFVKKEEVKLENTEPTMSNIKIEEKRVGETVIRRRAA